MSINDLNEKQNIAGDNKLSRIYNQLEALLRALKKKELPLKIIELLNQDIETINATLSTGPELRKLIKQKQTKILKLLENELKIVPKNHYRNLWLALGMSVFGIPLGIVFGLIIGNMGLLAGGLPIGMVIGIAVGTGMDKKAFDEGRQLDIEIKY